MSPSSAAAPPDRALSRTGLVGIARLAGGGWSARRTRADTVAAVLVAGAALIHGLLLPQHLAESRLFGAVFATIAVFQLGIGWALWTHAGPLVRTVGRWGSLAIVVMFLGARVIAPPGQAVPEDVTWVGILSLILEIGAVSALAVGLPTSPGKHSRAGSLWIPALVAGLAVFLLDLVAAGDLSYSQVTIPRPDAVGFYANGLGSLSPALTATLLHRWSLYLPLMGTALTLVVAGLLTVAIGMTLEVVRRRPHCSARLGLLGAVPASLAAPICCGPSLVSAAGVGAAAALSWLATPLLLLAASFLAIDSLWLWRILSRPAGPNFE